MKRVTKIAIGVGTALSLGLAAAVVSAQPYGYGPGWGMGPMGYGPMGRGMGPGMGPQAFANPGAFAESRLAGLKAELKITAIQEPAWKAFAEQAKQQADAMQTLMTSAQGSAQATAPERIELQAQFMKKRQEQMEKGAAAVKDLYAVLSPEQKALADQGFGPGMMGGRRMAFNRFGR